MNHAPLPRLAAQPRRRQRLSLAALGGAALVLGSAAASGMPCVPCSCTITSTAISFGSYDVLSSSALASTGTLGFSCTGGVPAGGVNFTIALATGSSSSFAARTMRSGANALNYNLYTSVAHTSVWGDGTSGTSTVTANYPQTNAPSVTVTVYALIPAKQNVLAGSYSDSITATVTF